MKEGWYFVHLDLVLYYIKLLDSLHYAKSSLTWIFSRSFSVVCVPFSNNIHIENWNTTAYTTNNTLQRHLTNKTTHNTKLEKHTSTCVYKLKCNDCPKFYIGQTGRSFKTQYIEHIEALTQPLIKLNFAEHIFNTHHTHTNIEKLRNSTCTTKRPQTKHHWTIWDIQTL